MKVSYLTKSVLISSISLLMAACSSGDDGTRVAGWSNVKLALLPPAIEEMLQSPYGEAQPDAEYQKEPPCNHAGDEKQWQAGKDQCTRKNSAHVAYWTARPDRWRIACRGQHPSYCDERNAAAGMIPHCHGFGKFRYCHAHPGGDSPHDHIHDMEFASNAKPDWP